MRPPVYLLELLSWLSFRPQLASSAHNATVLSPSLTSTPAASLAALALALNVIALPIANVIASALGTCSMQRRAYMSSEHASLGHAARYCVPNRTEDPPHLQLLR